MSFLPFEKSLVRKRGIIENSSSLVTPEPRMTLVVTSRWNKVEQPWGLLDFIVGSKQSQTDPRSVGHKSSLKTIMFYYSTLVSLLFILFIMQELANSLLLSKLSTTYRNRNIRIQQCIIMYNVTSCKFFLCNGHEHNYVVDIHLKFLLKSLSNILNY